jgi:hypothetical protein
MNYVGRDCCFPALTTLYLFGSAGYPLVVGIGAFFFFCFDELIAPLVYYTYYLLYD